MEKDYYKILGVERSATDEEINKAYRKIAMRSHPDRQQGKSEEEKKKAEEEFKLATEAKEVLLDAEKRKSYDMFGTAGAGAFGADSMFSEFVRHNFVREDGSLVWDTEDVAKWFSDCRSFRQQQRQRAKGAKGADKRVRLSVTFEELYNMETRHFEYHKQGLCGHCHGTGSADGRTHQCPQCGGQGYVTETYRRGNMISQTTRPCPKCGGTGSAVDNPCQKCGGTGMSAVEASESVRITPQMVIDGGVIIKGGGNASPQGGDNGDLIVAVELRPHDLYTIDENFNLFMEKNIPVIDALLGCQVDVPLINGTTQKMTIKECTEGGSKFRLAGMGMRRNDGSFGDLYVTVNHVFPAKINSDERNSLEKIKRMPNFK